MAKAQACDAVIFGAVGGPKWDKVPYDVRPEAGLLRLRKDLGLFANIRPAICYPALADASSLKRDVIDGLDIIIVRELTGGVYFGEPKTITDLGNGQKRAIDTQVYDTYEIERISRVGFELAKKRRNKLTSMEKRNVMKTGVLWNEVVTQVHQREFKDVQLEHQLADAGGMQLVRWPKQFDVIVTDNLFGDMLSDVAAMLTGSLGMLPSASLGELDPEDEKAQGDVRAGARLGARHRRQGRRQPDRHAGLVRHGAALLLQHGQGGRPARPGDRGRAGQGPAHRRHQVGRRHDRQHPGDGRRDHRRDEAAELSRRHAAPLPLRPHPEERASRVRNAQRHRRAPRQLDLTVSTSDEVLGTQKSAGIRVNWYLPENGLALLIEGHEERCQPLGIDKAKYFNVVARALTPTGDLQRSLGL